MEPKSNSCSFSEKSSATRLQLPLRWFSTLYIPKQDTVSWDSCRFFDSYEHILLQSDVLCRGFQCEHRFMISIVVHSSWHITEILRTHHWTETEKMPAIFPLRIEARGCRYYPCLSRSGVKAKWTSLFSLWNKATHQDIFWYPKPVLYYENLRCSKRWRSGFEFHVLLLLIYKHVALSLSFRNSWEASRAEVSLWKIVCSLSVLTSIPWTTIHSEQGLPSI